VPLTVAQLLQRLLAAAGLADRVDRTVLVHVAPEPGPHHRVIIRNQYAWHSASTWPGCQVRDLGLPWRSHSIGYPESYAVRLSPDRLQAKSYKVLRAPV